MRRFLFPALTGLALGLSAGLPQAQAANVSTELPPAIDGCFRQSIAGVFDIGSAGDAALFDYFLANIDVERFGQYNYKRAWHDWGDNGDIKRLALYEYFDLMAQKRAEHGGGVTEIDARLADNPAVTGDGIHHIVARIGFEDGSSAPIVVLAAGCKAFGFMYGGNNLRAFADPNLVEKLYAEGKRAP